MSEIVKSNISTIKQRDTGAPEHLDFDFLREKGLEHIGKFSGRIWTDHNTHDPGITTLEAVCYAILDLGYRTQLPIEDLLAQVSTDGTDNNFFTPAEILTCNPVTIIDYRKLLMEIDGIRNAWLEPATDATLYYDLENKFFCRKMATENPSDYYDVKTDEPLPPCLRKIDLNGLYRVYLELEPDVEKDSDQVEALKISVKQLLCAHRNLCEDFESIHILRHQYFKVCADVELAPGADANKTYAEILRSLSEFVNPLARFYSLQAMLEKGKTIEEIFAGRPYLANPNYGESGQPQFKSFGFLDTEELENLPRRRELHLSDLYTVVHEVPGVHTVRNLCIDPDKSNIDLAFNFSMVSEKDCADDTKWRLRLFPDYIPFLSTDNTTINLFSSGGKLAVDDQKIKKEITQYGKSRLTDSFLDVKPPLGVYRDDLDAYTSIQNEFPRVYGIGETGLPEEATLLRKAQALQLQAYLLFFDQLLADYLYQLGNIREVFSLQRESLRTPAQKHTYFSKALNGKDVPALNDLLRFQVGKNKGINEGVALAIPVATDELKTALCEIEAKFNKTLLVDPFGECQPDSMLNSVLLHQFASQYRNIRDAAIAQMQRDFEQKHYAVDVRLDLTGHYFILWPQSTPDIALVSGIHFAKQKEAREAANLAAFLGVWPDNWSVLNNQAEPVNRYSMNIAYRPVDYEGFISRMAEGEPAYLARREVFLEHLLSRFSEKFTDYASLTYYLAETDQGRRKTGIEHKSHFLSEYDEISRNRGKAFDYLKPAWNTDNVSGFEKRVSLLSGYGKGMRNSICNIEIIAKCDEYIVQIKDWKTDKVLLQTEKNLPSETVAKEVALSLRNTLKNTSPKVGFSEKDKLYTLTLKTFGVRFVYPYTQDLVSEKAALEKKQYINSLFSLKASPENVEVSAYEYLHELLDAGGKLFGRGEEPYPDLAAAGKKSAAFIKSVQAPSKGSRATAGRLALLELEKGKRYLDTAALYTRIVPLPLKWYWETTGKKNASGARFGSETEALLDFIESQDTSNLLMPQTQTWRWEMAAPGKIVLSGQALFPDENKTLTHWKLSKEFGADKNRYRLEQKDKSVLRIQLLDKQNKVLAQTGALDMTAETAAKTVDTFIGQFNRKNYQPEIAPAVAGWGFRLSEKDNLWLNSYGSYATKLQALQALLDAVALCRAGKTFLSEGGGPLNPEYMYLLTDAAGWLVAECPEPFDEKTDRDTTLKNAVKALKKWPAPVSALAEPRAYTYQLRAKKSDAVLTGAGEHGSEAEAESALHHLLPDLLIRSDVKMETGENGIIVRTPNKGIAVLENTTSKAAPAALERLSGELQQAVYSLEIRREPKYWRFVHFWENESGKLERVFRSVKQDFASPENARKAYEDFLQNLKNFTKDGNTIPHVFNNPDFPDSSFTLYDLTEQPLPDNGSINRYLAFYKDLDAPAQGRPDPWVSVIRSIPDNYYQLTKKGNPFAYHRSWLKKCKPKPKPESCTGETKTKLAVQRNMGEPCVDEYVELDAASFFQEEPWVNNPQIFTLPTGINGAKQYHFVLRGKIDGEFQSLLIGFKGYDTEYLAQQAFRAQLSRLLELAAEEANYGYFICLENSPEHCDSAGYFIATLFGDFKPQLKMDERIKLLAHYFRSLKKPLKDCYFENKEEACNVRDRLSIRDPNDYCWLDICIGAPGIVQLPTGESDLCKYHFVVKGSSKCNLPETNLLTSAQGYDTKALAVEAFQKQLWSLIELASDSANYGTKICLENCLDLKPDNCGRTGDFVAALHPDFMPGAPQSDRTAALARYFKSFPVRYDKTLGKYYFQLYDFNTLSADPDAIPDWTSWLCYDTYSAAFNGFEQLLDLLKYPSNCRVVCRGGKYRVELVETLMLSCRTYETLDMAWGRKRDGSRLAKTDKWVANPDEQEPTCTPEQIDPCTGFGAEAFLHAAQGENAFVKIEDTSTTPPTYGFQAVDDCYYVASHPCWYETRSEAESAYSAIMKQSDDWEKEIIKEGKEFYGQITLKKKAPFIQPEPCGCGDGGEKPFICKVLLKINLNANHSDAAMQAISDDIKAEKKYKLKIVQASDCGPYSFQWIDECCILAKSPVQFSTASLRDDAMARARECILTEGMHLVEHILLRRPLRSIKECAQGGTGSGGDTDSNLLEAKAAAIITSGVENNCLLCGCPDCDCELCWVDDPLEKDPCVSEENQPVTYIPFADAYSFWGTLVLPAWLKRFAVRESRDLFEKLLYREAPSHVALNILWLSPREMCQFETSYRYWLSEQLCEPDASFFQMVPCTGCETHHTEDTKCPCEISDLCRSEKSKDSPDCKLIECLQSLKADPFCPAQDTYEAPCKCGGKMILFYSNNLIIKSGKTTSGRFNILNCVSDNCDCKNQDGGGDQVAGIQPPLLTIARAAEENLSEAEVSVAPVPTAIQKTASVPGKTPSRPAGAKVVKNGGYKKRMQDRIVKMEGLAAVLGSERLLEQALFFLRGEAVFSEYKKLLRATDRETAGFQGKNNPHAQLVAFATAHLLDKALEKMEKGETAFAEPELGAQLEPLKKKGLQAALLSETWEGITLSAVFNLEHIDSLERLLA